MTQRVIAGAIGLVAIGGGLFTILRANEPKPDDAVQLETLLLADPVKGAFLKESKQSLPEDYAAIVPPLLQRAVDMPEAAQGFDAIFVQKMQAFQAANITAMAGAETEVLAEFADKQRDMMQMQRLCELAMSDNPTTLPASGTDSRKVAVARDIALLRAVASGRTHAVTRVDPTEAQDIALGEQLQAKLTPKQVEDMMSGALVTQPPAERCPVLGAYWRLIADMPAQESATWTAFVLKSEAQ